MSSENLEIRNCKLGDLSKIQKIEEASFDDPYSAIIFLSLFLNSKNIFRVAFFNEDIIGYSIVKLERGNETQVAHLVSLAIAPNLRRKGFGTKMLQDAILQIKTKYPQTKEMVLEVRADNSSAIALYIKFHFIKDYTISDYYGNGKDALVMKLDLLKS